MASWLNEFCQVLQTLSYVWETYLSYENHLKTYKLAEEDTVKNLTVIVHGWKYPVVLVDGAIKKKKKITFGLILIV